MLPEDDYVVYITAASGAWTYPEIKYENLLKLDSLSKSTGSYGGHQVAFSGKGMPNSASDINAWLICSKTTPITILSAAPDSLLLDIPPFDGTTACKVNVTIDDDTFKTVSYTYDEAKTPSITVTQNSGFEYLLAETNLTTVTFDSVDFVVLDANNEPTSSSYSMIITAINDTHSTLSPEGGYLPAGRFAVKAHSVNNGFAIKDSSEYMITVDVLWSADPTASVVTSSYAGGK